MNELISLEKIAQWQKLKTLVLDSVSSPITKRVYSMALDEFMGWFQQAPRPGFTKATVSAWRVSLEDRRLGSSSIIIKSAIRKLAAEAADNGLLAPELAAGISRVKSAKSQGIRVGNEIRVSPRGRRMTTLPLMESALLSTVARSLVQIALEPQPLIPARPLEAGEQYRFHFHMTKCIGCKCCVVACNEQNGNPAALNWRRVGELEGGHYPHTQRYHLSMGCNHCVE